MFGARIARLRVRRHWVGRVASPHKNRLSATDLTPRTRGLRPAAAGQALGIAAACVTSRSVAVPRTPCPAALLILPPRPKAYKMLSSALLWSLVILSIELALSPVTGRVITFGLAIVLGVAALIMQNGFELLAITSVMAFSATALLLYLLTLSTEGHAKLALRRLVGNTNYAVLGLTALSATLLLCVSAGVAAPAYSVRWFDLSAALCAPAAIFISTIHALLTRYFLLEACLLNVFLFFCFLSSLAVLARVLVPGAAGSPRVPVSLRARRAWRRFSSSTTRG